MTDALIQLKLDALESRISSIGRALKSLNSRLDSLEVDIYLISNKLKRNSIKEGINMEIERENIEKAEECVEELENDFSEMKRIIGVDVNHSEKEDKK